MDFEQTSKALGLSPLQTEILVQLLEEGGEATAPLLFKKLSRQRETNRTSIYLALDQLSEKFRIVTPSVGDKKQKKYALVSTDPDRMIQILLKPQEKAVKDFLSELKAVKERKKDQLEEMSSYYSLKGRDKVMDQVSNLFAEARSYILILANTTMLDLIYPSVKSKKEQMPDIEIFVQITWNPTPDLSIDSIAAKYEKLVGDGRVARPHELLKEIFSRLNPPNLNGFNIDQDIIANYLLRARSTHFIQLLTDTGYLIGTHFGLGNDLGGGTFTRDPFTTQAHHVLFFVVFESTIDNPVDKSTRQRILLARILQNFEKMRSF